MNKKAQEQPQESTISSGNSELMFEQLYNEQNN